MSQFWTIAAADTGQLLCPRYETASPDLHPKDSGWAWVEGEQVAVQIAEGGDTNRWDWDPVARSWALSPQAARDEQWRAAQDFREIRRNASLAVYGVFPDRAVTVKMDVESRLTISGAVQTATIFKASGLPFTFTFDDEAGVETTVDADQTVALGLGVAIYSGLCDGRLRAIRAELDAALAEGATAETINAITVTSGYPATGVPAE